jgi:subfamily B ATP-binding cassette protein HlyB/CyaB
VPDSVLTEGQAGDLVPTPEPQWGPAEAAVTAVAALARLRGLPAERADLRHQAGIGPGAPALDLPALLRLAAAAGLDARVRRVGRRGLAGVAFPAIAEMRDGGFALVARADGARVLLLGADDRPDQRTRAEFDAAWTGRLVTATVAADRAGSAGPAPVRLGLRSFLPALGAHRGLLAQVLAASLFLQIFGLATPLFSMVVIDKVLASGSVGTLDVLVIGLALMAVFEASLGLLRGLLLAHGTGRLDAELGARLFDHLTALPLAYFESRPAGALVARVKELESIRAFLTGPGLTVLLDLAFAVVFLAVMWGFSPALTVTVLGVVALLALLHAAVAPALRRRMVDRFAKGADAQAFLVEAVQGVEALKSLAAEPRLRRRWQDLLVENGRAARRAAALSEATNQAAGFLTKAMAAAVLWQGAHLVIAGELTAGALIAFNMLAGRVAMPVMRLAQMWQQVQQARVAVQKVGDVLEAIPEPGALPGRTPPGAIEGRVTFRDVAFRYAPGGPAVLDGLRLDVPAGQVVGIVGLSGSGKSTLAKLLQRLHVPERGAVLVDGVDLAGVDPAWLRRQVGVVPQEVSLFNRTIRENIAFADPSLPMERVAAAARLAGAHDFIAALPEGYDTVVGERGMRLSGGQRQRVALARALATDPRILVLDEATSALDCVAEAIFHRDLRRIGARRTVFVIAHRLAAVRGADRILVIAGGRVAEDGTHAELLAAGGLYARLHAIQAGTEGEAPGGGQGGAQGGGQGAPAAAKAAPAPAAKAAPAPAAKAATAAAASLAPALSSTSAPATAPAPATASAFSSPPQILPSPALRGRGDPSRSDGGWGCGATGADVSARGETPPPQPSPAGQGRESTEEPRA